MMVLKAYNCVADVQRVGDASPVDYSQWNSVQAKELPSYEVVFYFLVTVIKIIKRRWARLYDFEN